MNNFLHVHEEYIAKLPQGLQNRIARGFVKFYSTSLCQTNKTSPLLQAYTDRIINTFDFERLLKLKDIALESYNELDEAVNQDVDNYEYKDMYNRQLLKLEILNFAVERKRN